MDITTMGERIKELRKNAGMTQEELGAKIGVTAQAVSKWDCGSVPDTELIPKIADCFDVSIDALFGREYENYDVYNLMSKHIIEAYDMENGEEEVRRRALRNCWVAFAASCGVGMEYHRDYREYEQSETTVDECMNHKNKHSKIYTDKLLAFMDRSEDMPFFVYMPEADGRAKKLLDDTDYCSLFAALGDPDFFRAVVFLFSHKNTRFTKGRFIAKLGLSEERADEILAMLQKHNFVVVRELELDESVIDTYAGNWIPYFVMMLQSAYYFRNLPSAFCWSVTARTEPLLKLDD
ncbi:MAG: helix-turn-helix transcriptional regulator [Clostridia bacterium]|nr:helix-turn-helix transcriptional regulator [Clostridia bacterium]